MEGSREPIMPKKIFEAIMDNQKCRNYFQRTIDNLRTKIRSKIEMLDKLIDTTEVEILENIFAARNELKLRELQNASMLNEDWKTNKSCVPQTILEKIMLLLGFCNIDERDNTMGLFTTANMEAALISALIWRQIKYSFNIVCSSFKSFNPWFCLFIAFRFRYKCSKVMTYADLDLPPDLASQFIGNKKQHNNILPVCSFIAITAKSIMFDIKVTFNCCLIINDTYNSKFFV